MKHRYNGSQVLFRRALACSYAARDQAARAAQEIAGGCSGMEPRQRARDAVIETIILTQAAAESYVNWIYLEANVTAKSRSWIPRWTGLREVATYLGRPGVSLPAEYSRFFTELGAWRNYLVHGDERARKTLLAALAAQRGQGRGDFTDDAEDLSILDGDYAASIIERAEAAFSWAARHTGIQAPFVEGAWVNPREWRVPLTLQSGARGRAAQDPPLRLRSTSVPG